MYNRIALIQNTLVRNRKWVMGKCKKLIRFGKTFLILCILWVIITTLSNEMKNGKKTSKKHRNNLLYFQHAIVERDSHDDGCGCFVTVQVTLTIEGMC